MAGSPKRRARLDAMNVRNGGEAAAAASRRATPPARAGAPAAEVSRPAGPSEFETLLGGLRADELDNESQAQFAELRTLAFQFAKEIMELPLDAGNKNFTKILSAKQAIATAMLTATVRVRPGDLRDRDDDGVTALLDEVKKAGVEPAVEDPMALFA